MARRLFLSTARSISMSVALAAPLVMPIVAPLVGLNVCRAEDAPADVANSRNSALATINSDGVYVRSGPGDSYYPTTKLTKDTPVTVVGEKFDWLKIAPPANSFCYVAKAFIEKNPDGTTGAAMRDEVNVRAGSELNTIKTSVSAKLHAGQQVKILGEVDEYYKIAPPADAYVYVKKDYVELKQVIPQVARDNAGSPTTVAPIPTPDGSGSTIAGGATTQPSGLAPTDVASATTQPAGIAAAETTFDKLEAQFTESSTKNIEQQPLDEMTAGYTKLLADASLPQSMKQIADFRLQTLKVRSTTRNEFVATQKQQAEAKQKQVAMKAEAEEIAQQIKQKDVQVYTAVGTLRTSSLQQGTATLYRLTDPQTGRTVCYIRSDDAKYGTLLGQFIGVKGAVSSDTGLNMKVVAPTEFAAVDPNQLYRGVAAQIVPPSLLPAATVSPQLAEPASGTDKPQASAGDK